MIKNCLIINKYANNKSSSISTDWFIFSSVFHNYQTFDSVGNLQIPSAPAVLGETKLIFWSMGKKEIAPKK